MLIERYSAQSQSINRIIPSDFFFLSFILKSQRITLTAAFAQHAAAF